MTYINPRTVPVPTANSTDNVNIQDAVGNKTDKSYSDGQLIPSILGHLKANYYHVHDSAKVYPSGANPVQVTANAAAWNETGTPAVIVGTGGISEMFDIHWAIISNVSAAGDYELILKNAGGEIARCAFSRNAVQDRASHHVPVQVPPQAADTQITAVLSSGSTNADTCEVKLYYHTYPDVT